MKPPLVLMALMLCVSAGAAAAAISSDELILRSRARAPAPKTNVVLLTVQGVEAPEALPGACKVSALVEEVLEGSSLTKGMVITVPVPCGAAPRFRRAGTPLTRFEPEALTGAKQGLARLDEAGALVWQGRAKLYPRWGSIVGFRIVGEGKTFVAPGGDRV